MKQTIKTRIFRVLSVALFLLGGLLAAGRAEAQTAILDDITLGQHPGQPWVSVGEAMTILEGTIEASAVQLGFLTPGTTPYENLLFHITYYKLILHQLEGSATVPNSVLTGLDEMMTVEGYATDVNPAFTTNSLRNVYGEAVDLLTY
ncbi:MAG: hypothetical protein SFV52_07230 [Saprospiraceae bacterium]|nr:hypothetical protein [Saprospiraceae bacterium]